MIFTKTSLFSGIKYVLCKIGLFNLMIVISSSQKFLMVATVFVEEASFVEKFAATVTC